MRERFDRFAESIADGTGSPWAFGAALLIVLVWGVAGPLMHFSDLWLLLINTVTTVVTFVMVFIIQADQNRTSRAAELKLDELIRAVHAADDTVIDAEHQTQQQMDDHSERLKGER